MLDLYPASCRIPVQMSSALHLAGYFWLDAFMFCIGVIVANVPEGLMAVITIALSVSASRLQVNFYQMLFIC